MKWVKLVILTILFSGLTSAIQASPPAPVTDLQILFMDEPREERAFQLVWTAPTSDIYGNPIVIDSYQVYMWFTPHFEIEESVLLGEVSDTCYTFVDPDQWYPGAFFQVTAFGSSQMPPPEMVFVPAGTFSMGHEETNGVPVHQVTLTRDFFIGISEVTNGEYIQGLDWAYSSGLLEYVSNSSIVAHDRVLINPSHSGCEILWNGENFELEPVYSGNYEGLSAWMHPVLEVSWYGAACFCDWLSIQEGLTPFYNGDWSVTSDHNPYEAEGYRLPTEAEWEFASRGSENRFYPWGNEPADCDKANFNPGSSCVGWTAPVGSCLDGDSELGIHDLAGNLWEWVNDFWSEYSDESITDPLGPPNHPYPYRSFRGGSWYYGEDRLPSAHRNFNDPANTREYLSFRVCRSALDE